MVSKTWKFKSIGFPMIQPIIMQKGITNIDICVEGSIATPNVISSLSFIENCTTRIIPCLSAYIEMIILVAFKTLQLWSQYKILIAQSENWVVLSKVLCPTGWKELLNHVSYSMKLQWQQQDQRKQQIGFILEEKSQQCFSIDDVSVVWNSNACVHHLQFSLSITILSSNAIEGFQE